MRRHAVAERFQVHSEGDGIDAALSERHEIVIVTVDFETLGIVRLIPKITWQNLITACFLRRRSLDRGILTYAKT